MKSSLESHIALVIHNYTAAMLKGESASLQGAIKEIADAVDKEYEVENEL